MKARAFIRTGNPWRATTPAQDWFMNNIFQNSFLDSQNIPELKSIATDDAKATSHFIKENKLQATPSKLPKGYFSIFSSMDLKINWTQPASEAEITIGQNKYKAGTLQTRISLMLPPLNYQDARVDNPVILVDTIVPNQQILIYKSKRAPLSNLELLSRINTLVAKSLPVRVNQPIQVTYPLFDIEKTMDVGWMRGLEVYDASGLPLTLHDAVQRNKVAVGLDGVSLLNQIRTRTLGATQPSTKTKQTNNTAKQLIVDEPFYFAIIRRNQRLPLVAAYVTQDDWLLNSTR